MKVLLVNGSPHKNGCTHTALGLVADVLHEEGIETEEFWIGIKPIGGCIACHQCDKRHDCVFDDAVNVFRKKALEADGFLFGSPVHYAALAGNMKTFLDRAFYSEARGNGNKAFYLKPAAAVISARRAGTTAAFDEMNKYFAIQEMPIVSSRYWNQVHGTTAEEVLKDKEGVWTLHVLGRNMAYLLKAMELAKKANLAQPQKEPAAFMNFIHGEEA
ncbi:flavodoxin family protein [Acidaminococcus intestini]|uniref:flavodoxin family protein n=1 Tax=Acidaminococcus intestini TaxID=187327 RepID=UPI0027BA4D2B|nr:flavodoxin family protein [Acidaminococcus intestini]